MVDEEFSKRIKDAIALSGKSQRKIAEEMGITPQGLSKAAREGVMARDTIERFCLATGGNFEQLATGKSASTPPPLHHSPRTRTLLDRIAELVAAGRISEGGAPGVAISDHFVDASKMVAPARPPGVGKI